MLQRGRPRAASCNLTGTPNDILCPSYRNTFEAAAPSWQRSGNVCFGFVTVLSPKSLPDLAIFCAMRQNDVKQNPEITNTSISQVLKCPCDRSCARKAGSIKVTHKDGPSESSKMNFLSVGGFLLMSITNLSVRRLEDTRLASW